VKRLFPTSVLAVLALQGSVQESERAVQTLRVVPESGWRVRGPLGGPFHPEKKLFVLHDAGDTALSWTARVSEPWLLLSSGEGRLEPGDHVGVAVALDPRICADLPQGTHGAQVEFLSSGAEGALVRPVELLVLPRAGLRVAPEAELSLFVSPGAAQGFVAGAEADAFVVGNGGSLTVRWSARASRDWLRLSPEEGTLDPRARTTVRVEVDPASSGKLALGSHRATVEFTNLTDGVGNASREVRVFVRGARGLAVSSQEDVRSRDPAAGQAEVARYLLRNEGDAAIRWEARSSEGWLLAEPERGDLAPGAEVAVVARATIDRDRADGAAQRRGALAFVNRTDGVGTTSRWIELGTGALGPDAGTCAAPEQASSLSQHGITWTFDRPYPVGRFVNGDRWVVGPLQILAIDPPSRRSGNRTRNGSMLNPSPRSGLTQGYDSACYGEYADKDSFDPRSNVAAELASWQPLLLPAGSSLVSTISHPTAGARPQLGTAAILTVLDAPAPEDSFRPPYCGTDKTPRYRREGLHTELLARLLPVASTPPWPEVEAWFERPWIDHVSLWAGNYIHPARNMPNYGRELCDQVSTAALMLHLDVPDERKETLLVRFVQLGIDLWGIVQDGGSWPPAAGHMSGRKWPILFAGLLLADPDLSGVGLDPALEFGEDGQTFYVEETPPGSGRFNGGQGGYGPEHAGLAEWGTAHARQLWNDDADWFGDPYRLCCTANAWWGELLAACVMGAKPLWNHDALFDYQERYLRENVARGVTDWRLSWRPFYLDMWREYRPRY